MKLLRVALTALVMMAGQKNRRLLRIAFRALVMTAGQKIGGLLRVAFGSTRNDGAGEINWRAKSGGLCPPLFALF